MGLENYERRERLIVTKLTLTRLMDYTLDAFFQMAEIAGRSSDQQTVADGNERLERFKRDIQAEESTPEL